ncbi:putative prolin-rich extensin-like receptor protein kinase family protein [Iris pallida]|uniref:Prolin-rich extensin-like receptor protein kinase family protein n=1 Tax=Iris pallida TaxID=29817 RepID=A0AAX6ELU7_IRIPA|nr:putative prolin-rich extensin-like receptor protein kinase family protein [Iris pallida]KAJ6804881.1 putative prolin-rich extensin-like receptor protein kinase family protein [Iris pallida]
MTARPESEATLRTPSSSLSVTLRMTSYSIMAIMTRSSTLRRYQSRLWRTLILGLQNQMLR